MTITPIELILLNIIYCLNFYYFKLIHIIDIFLFSLKTASLTALSQTVSMHCVLQTDRRIKLYNNYIYEPRIAPTHSNDPYST